MPSAADTYKIVGRLGSGFFGDVYTARHVHLDRDVALKVLRTDRLTDPDGLLDEARKLAGIPEHDNVVRVHDAGPWDDGTVYIATELCPGGSLEDLAVQPMDPASACEHAAAISRGLDHMHENGLLHLDVRPANALIGADGHVKLVDFGLSRWADSAQVDNWYLPHAAPELHESGQASRATDVYAAAMTLGHLLTGGAICKGPPTGTEFLTACSNGKWPRLDLLGPHVPKRLKKAIRDSTSYLESKRPQAARDLKALIDRAAPATSFSPDGQDRYRSADGTWTVELVPRSGAHDVVVKRNSRKVGALCSTHDSRKDVERALVVIMEDFAKH